MQRCTWKREECRMSAGVMDCTDRGGCHNYIKPWRSVRQERIGCSFWRVFSCRWELTTALPAEQTRALRSCLKKRKKNKEDCDNSKTKASLSQLD
ncbi:hypothetical protein MHYP_G00162190 [Metynnis hypsauchen]